MGRLPAQRETVGAIPDCAALTRLALFDTQRRLPPHLKTAAAHHGTYSLVDACYNKRRPQAPYYRKLRFFMIRLQISPRNYRFQS